MMAITKVVTDFLEGVVIDDVVVLQSGLINSTYKVSTSKGDFILQKNESNGFSENSCAIE